MNLLEALSGYGADVPGTMERLMGDVEVYDQCIHLLLEDPAFSELQNAAARGDSKAAFESAHALKGVSANLGLTPLFDAVCAVVEPLRQSESANIAPQLSRLNEERQKLAELMRKVAAGN